MQFGCSLSWTGMRSQEKESWVRIDPTDMDMSYRHEVERTTLSIIHWTYMCKKYTTNQSPYIFGKSEKSSNKKDRTQERWKLQVGNVGWMLKQFRMPNVQIFKSSRLPREKKRRSSSSSSFLLLLLSSASPNGQKLNKYPNNVFFYFKNHFAGKFKKWIFWRGSRT